MNIFVLNTGRCGSLTFAKACRHITNFTSGHESNIGICGPTRLKFPDNHIEVDNRLSWFLGRLDFEYGNRAFYVHLRRNRDDVVASFAKREGGIMKAYTNGGIIFDRISPLAAAADYYETVTANIELFLRDKTQKMVFQIESANEALEEFWTAIGAQGDKQLALDEFKRRYNAS